MRCVIQGLYSGSPKVGNPIASILKSDVKGIPALIVLSPVSNFLGFTIWVCNAIVHPEISVSLYCGVVNCKDKTTL